MDDPEQAPRTNTTMTKVGIGMLLFGLLIAYTAYTVDTTVGSDPDRVNNIGLMQEQLMLFQAGLALSLGGLATILVAKVRR